jgi:probable phosphoglycerate mutase
MSATTTRFILVRHGEACGNRELRYLGVTDSPLTERGRDQAGQLAPVVRAFTPAALYTSPLARARATAEAMAAATGLPVCIEDDLREQSFGQWEMLTRAEVRAADGERLAAWESGADVAPPDGETLVHVRARVLGLTERLLARHPGETLALVSHVSPIKALVCAALELAPAGAMRMWLDPASICVVDWRRTPDGLDGGDAPGGHLAGMLRVFNAIAHLDPPAPWLTRYPFEHRFI